jgi:hypothetical protein
MLHCKENLLPVVPGLPEAERARRQMAIDGAERRLHEMMQEFLPRKKKAKAVACPLVGMFSKQLNF